MYRTILHSLPGVFLALLVLSCASKKEDAHDLEHAGSGDEHVWKEMDDFHMIMAETFHPYKDSSNLEPAKTRAAELLAAADEWATAPLPEKVDTQEVKAKLTQLKAEAETLAERVKSSDDNVIGEHLTKLHDTFHSIQEVWYGGR